MLSRSCDTPLVCKVRAYLRQEFGNHKRLADVIVGAGGERGEGGARIRQRGEHHDRNLVVHACEPGGVHNRPWMKMRNSTAYGVGIGDVELVGSSSW